MAPDPGVGLTLLFQAALLGVVATAIFVVGTVLAPPKWVDSPDGASRWVEEARLVVRETQQVLDDGESRSYDRLQRRLLPLSSRLDRHAEIAPPAVDDRLVVGLTELGYGCRAVGMELTRAERLDWSAPGGDVATARSVAAELVVALDGDDGDGDDDSEDTEEGT
ncbi:hypothetical protein SAMN04487950_1672 [Halogranum rubrum]|uniref:Uncharacterized protein n=1 Tax=Halogranum rubrum TaxID=553466 RepID=A0A1I4DAQ2_9EURY|nr:hypothetical protein [Halogranum rubrum]SFK89001.1 hypothetical protein SAMN04487950_1672 [Halogranum rubrum]